jgi:hypothetical protein
MAGVLSDQWGVRDFRLETSDIRLETGDRRQETCMMHNQKHSEEDSGFICLDRSADIQSIFMI